jgi:glycosyltransferase involved in cell wall biosynthesis
MVVSQTLQQYYRQRYNRDTVYVPNGATLAPARMPRRLSEWNLRPDNYVLFLGRFSPEKNCHLLIEAFENIHTDMKLVLAGGSSHSDGYVKSLSRHESERVRFLPWVSGRDLEELLGHAALFVLPSELEGLSLALLDAMAAYRKTRKWSRAPASPFGAGTGTILRSCSTCSSTIRHFAAGRR